MTTTKLAQPCSPLLSSRPPLIEDVTHGRMVVLDAHTHPLAHHGVDASSVTFPPARGLDGGLPCQPVNVVDHVEVSRTLPKLLVARGVRPHRADGVARVVGDDQVELGQAQHPLELADVRLGLSGFPARDGGGGNAECHREVTLAEVGQPPDATDHANDVEEVCMRHGQKHRGRH